jgi:hypothetical protein
MAHRMLFGKLSAFVCAHDFFPQPRDMFWSPGPTGRGPAVFSGRRSCCCRPGTSAMPLLAYNGVFGAASIWRQRSGRGYPGPGGGDDRERYAVFRNSGIWRPTKRRKR